MMNWFRGFVILVLFGFLTACGNTGGGDGVRPTISSFTANPSTITAEQTSTLSWSVSGATSLTLNPGNVDVTGETSHEVSPDSTTTYTLTATNANGSTQQSTTVTVTEDGNNNQPVIQSFTANPSTIQAGESSTLSWSVSGATSLTLNPGNIDVTGQTSRVVSPESTTTYTLVATNANGSTQQSTTVNVTTDGTGETFSKHGYVILQETGEPGGESAMVSGTGSFYSTDEPQPVPSEEDFLNTMTDTCVVVTEGEEQPEPTPVPYPTTTSLDAGPQLTVSAGGNTYATLDKQTVENSIFYTTDFMNPPAVPLPDSGLTVSIPGAQGGFPAFTNAAFGNGPSFTLTAPADPNNITKSATFSWSGSSSTSIVILTGSGQNASGKAVTFSCIAEDDGSFAFPAATQAELDAAGFTTGSLTAAGRSNYEIYREGDAVLFLITARYNFFNTLQ
jgi:copper(I)-binding protein